MVKCMVVDDEPLALQVLATYISRLDHLKLVASVRSAEKAMSFLSHDKVDLLFLDIKMPRLDGIELLKSLSDPPAVIFTTAHREYAIEGFELNVIDYLLKPFSFERFLKAVNRFTNMRLQQPLSKTDDTANEEKYLLLKADKKRIQKIYLPDILYIESLKNYCRIQTAKQQFISYQSISSLEKLLPVGKFIRIHRSYIVAVAAITSLSATDVELSGVNIPVGRMYKNELAKLLRENGIDGTYSSGMV